MIPLIGFPLGDRQPRLGQAGDPADHDHRDDQCRRDETARATPYGVGRARGARMPGAWIPSYAVSARAASIARLDQSRACKKARMICCNLAEGTCHMANSMTTACPPLPPIGGSNSGSTIWRSGCRGCVSSIASRVRCFSRWPHRRAGLLLNPLFHEIGLTIAIGFGVIALGRGIFTHGYMMPAVVGAAGLGMMAGAISLPHDGERAWRRYGR